MLAESDSETTASPVKKRLVPRRRAGCKTYEEIRLAEIQAESAAYYSYQSSHHFVGEEQQQQQQQQKRESHDFQILTLDEIRKRKLERAMRSEEEEAKSSLDSPRTTMVPPVRLRRMKRQMEQVSTTPVKILKGDFEPKVEIGVCDSSTEEELLHDSQMCEDDLTSPLDEDEEFLLLDGAPEEPFKDVLEDIDEILTEKS